LSLLLHAFFSILPGEGTTTAHNITHIRSSTFILK
jgi:hypothetical protein